MHNIHAPTQKLSVRTTFVRLRQVPLRINAVKPFLFFLAYCMIFRKKIHSLKNRYKKREQFYDFNHIWISMILKAMFFMGYIVNLDLQCIFSMLLVLHVNY